MRILHVATLFSPDGAYGGPTRVAVNQAVGLVELGHRVLIAGAARGYAALPTEIAGVPAILAPGRQLIPGAGYAGLAAPGLLRRVAGLTPAPDLVHVHLARDLVTLPIAAWAVRRRLPLVVQTHGMIDASDRLLAKPLDRVLTVPVLRAARKVYCLTESEVTDIHTVAGANVRCEVLPNGVPVPDSPISSDAPRVNEVVYVGRLHPRKRPMLFIRAAQEAIRQGADCDFVLIGPDEGEGNAVREALATDNGGGRIRWIGALPPAEISPRLQRATLLANTTDNERFGMSVIEAMAAGCPVVVGESCGVSAAIASHGCGTVVTEDVAAYAQAFVALLADRSALARMGRAASAYAGRNYGIRPVVERLARDYAAERG